MRPLTTSTSCLTPKVTEVVWARVADDGNIARREPIVQIFDAEHPRRSAGPTVLPIDAGAGGPAEQRLVASEHMEVVPVMSCECPLSAIAFGQSIFDLHENS